MTSKSDLFLRSIDSLIAQNLPLPSSRCNNCGNGTIYVLNQRFQCPECGARSTQYGGIFPNISIKGEALECDPEWKSLCERSKSELDKIMREGA